MSSFSMDSRYGLITTFRYPHTKKKHSYYAQTIAKSEIPSAMGEILRHGRFLG